MNGFQYVGPQHVEDLADCYFYHKMSLPKTGDVGHSWDLRECIDDYLGQCDFQQKRVLDVGTASGYLTFEMEKRGADVVSYDMPTAKNWNIVPHYTVDTQAPKVVQEREDTHRKLQNAFWYAHRELNSQAKVHYGDVYDQPAELGNFDIVMLGMMISHVRDPFQAIYSAARLSKDLVIITNQGGQPEGKRRWYHRLRRSRDYPQFMPSRQDVVLEAWWYLPPGCLARMMGTIGFEVIRQIQCEPVCMVNGRQGTEPCFSMVFQRIGGTPAGIAKAA